MKPFHFPFEETLKLVQTTNDVATLRQEIGVLRQSLYRVGRGSTGRASRGRPGLVVTRPGLVDQGGQGAFERALQSDVRAVVAEAMREDLRESRTGNLGNLGNSSRTSREGRESRGSTTSRASSASRASRTSREGREEGGWLTATVRKPGSVTVNGDVTEATNDDTGSVAVTEHYSRTQVEEFLEGLEEKLVRLKPIRLTMAFEPTREMIGNISNIINHKSYTKGERAAGVVLDLEVEPTILGGIQLATAEGRFYDLSVAGKIEGILESSRTEIVQYLKRKVGEREKEGNQVIR